MSEIKCLLDIPFGYMLKKNDCEHCPILQVCTYEQLGYCFAKKNEKDRVNEEPEEE